MPRRRTNQQITEKLEAYSQFEDPTLPLSESQRMFVHNLVHNKLNQTAAARQAGFSGPSSAAYEMMRNPKIMHAIALEREEYARASGMTKQKVIDGFTEAIDMARIKADPLAMISGWREIGKMCGFYAPTTSEVKLSVQGRVMVERINSMTDEELLALAHEDPSILDGEFDVIPESE